MIQRKQTLFILISLVFTFLIIFSVDLINSKKYNLILNSSNESALSMFFYASFLIGLISIFLYKNRLLQHKICLLNMYFHVCPIIFSVCYIFDSQCYPNITELTGLFFIGISLIFYWLAARYIKKDEELIKSIDRIR